MTEARPTADAITTTFVPRLRDHVASVPVQHEAVLYEEDTGTLHQLDAIATVVCGSFDGEVSVARIVDDLAEQFGADREVVEVDVLAMVRHLAGLGLLDGVGPRAAVEEDVGVG